MIEITNRKKYVYDSTANETKTIEGVTEGSICTDVGTGKTYIFHNGECSEIIESSGSSVLKIKTTLDGVAESNTRYFLGVLDDGIGEIIEKLEAGEITEEEADELFKEFYENNELDIYLPSNPKIDDEIYINFKLQYGDEFPISVDSGDIGVIYDNDVNTGDIDYTIVKLFFKFDGYAWFNTFNIFEPFK